MAQPQLGVPLLGALAWANGNVESSLTFPAAEIRATIFAVMMFPQADVTPASLMQGILPRGNVSDDGAGTGHVTLSTVHTTGAATV